MGRPVIETPIWAPQTAPSQKRPSCSGGEAEELDPASLPVTNRVCSFGSLEGISKSVKVLLNGLEEVMVLTFIILK